MRYLGSKDLIVSEIFKLLEEQKFTDQNMTLFDAFCGTGAVSNALKSNFDIIANDNLSWSVEYTRGRLVANTCKFEKLGFDPFEFFNSNQNKTEGFLYKNYSPGGSFRMYFTADNAARIDYFRKTIEDWKNNDLISCDEYSYLIFSLIESVSSVSNTAGVYGAFLKHWDSRAKKDIQFIKKEISSNKHKKLNFLNSKIEEVIDSVECDILYLDPPYTQNQYGTQYHLLETLVLNDNPSMSKITGSRPTGPMRSDWSKEYKAHILFDQIISKTKAKYILFSYSTDGIMTKSFIEASLKRYGNSDSYICKKIAYKKYRNFKTKRTNEHFEYLFFIEKKLIKDVQFVSPLNYIGSKAKMMNEIKDHLPERVENNAGFIDAFGGGCNVGINMSNNKVIYNELNHYVAELINSFKINDTYKYIQFIKQTIKKFVLEPADSESYLKLRTYYNSLPASKRDPRLLYTLISYGFNQQIRFNSDHNFNNPVGMRWFNDKVLEKMISFSRAIKEKQIIIHSKNYTKLIDDIEKSDFIYLDPPYRLTLGSYNDGKRGFKGWSLESEKELLSFVDNLHKNESQFMMSYVLEHGGNYNYELKNWIDENDYRVVYIEGNINIKRKEVLIMNY